MKKRSQNRVESKSGSGLTFNQIGNSESLS